MPFFAGIPYRAGFAPRVPFLLTHPVSDRRHEGAKHEAEYTLDVIRAFGIPAERADSYETPLRHRAGYSAEKIMERLGLDGGAEIVALHPGASCPSKRWPLDRFASLGLKIHDEFPGKIIAIVGGPGEKEMGESLAREIGGKTLDLTGQLDLKELAGFLSRCEALVSNDSGPVHIAAAVGTRTLTIFGRSLPGLGAVRWRALGHGHVVLQKDVGCVVCLAHRCTIDFECLKAVTVDEVRSKLRDFMPAREKVSAAG